MNTQEKKEQREKVIQSIAEQMRHAPFTFEFKVVKNPKGIKIIHEVTQKEMDILMQAARGGEE